jgi:hypothetical protein
MRSHILKFVMDILSDHVACEDLCMIKIEFEELILLSIETGILKKLSYIKLI